MSNVDANKSKHWSNIGLWCTLDIFVIDSVDSVDIPRLLHQFEKCESIDQ